MTEPPFEPEAVLAALHRHGVRYILIGGLAAVLHGSANVTLDVDVVPELSDENLGRLSEALTELEARVRVEGIDGGLPFSHDADSLRGMVVLNVTTTAGNVDVTQSPDGVGGFDAWDERAGDVVALGVPIRLASLADVIRSKEAADRIKDRATLPLLRRLAERKAERGDA